MEYASGGYLKYSHKQDFLLILFQIIDALHYLHETVQIVHCDVKEENIVQRGHEIKIIDFGSAQFLDLTLFERGGHGSSHVDHHSNPSRGDHPDLRKKDVWDFGMMLFRLMTGARRALTVSFKEMKEWDHFMSGQHFHNLSDDIRKLIVECLKEDPQERPSFGQLLSKTCFQKYNYLKKRVSKVSISKEDIRSSIKCLKERLNESVSNLKLSEMHMKKLQRKKNQIIH